MHHGTLTQPLCRRSPWCTCASTATKASWSYAAATPEEPGLYHRVRRLGTQPDGEKRFGEVLPFHRARHRAIDVHLDTHARLVGKGQLLSTLERHHPAVQLRNALLEGRQLGLAVGRQAFLPGLLEGGAVHVA